MWYHITLAETVAYFASRRRNERDLRKTRELAKTIVSSLSTLSYPNTNTNTLQAPFCLSKVAGRGLMFLGTCASNIAELYPVAKRQLLVSSDSWNHLGLATRFQVLLQKLLASPMGHPSCILEARVRAKRKQACVWGASCLLTSRVPVIIPWKRVAAWPLTGGRPGTRKPLVGAALWAGEGPWSRARAGRGVGRRTGGRRRRVPVTCRRRNRTLEPPHVDVERKQAARPIRKVRMR